MGGGGGLSAYIQVLYIDNILCIDRLNLLEIAFIANMLLFHALTLCTLPDAKIFSLNERQ